MKASVGIVVLAAGFSKRMGRQKLLLPYGEESMVRHVVKKALQTKASQVVVVFNPEYSHVYDEIIDLPVVILANPESYQGMSSSVRRGFAHLEEEAADGGLVLLADQPEMDPNVVDQVILRFQETKKAIVQAAYEGKPGHPVLFSRALFRDLQQISGDQGGRQLIAAHASRRELVQVRGGEPEDIDTLEDYQRVTRKGGNGK